MIGLGNGVETLNQFACNEATTICSKFWQNITFFSYIAIYFKNVEQLILVEDMAPCRGDEA